MIQATHLTKRYGGKTAVDDLSFAVAPGRVTGFLGPNGAGKSTTMRMIVGLAAPSAGNVTIDGVPYRDLRAPLRVLGSLLDAQAFDPRRTAADHLRWLVTSNALDPGRVDELLGLVGLADVAGRRVGEFSLGMQQRLGIATALVGDPETVMLDEPINGLDPEGILWLRGFLRQLADEGRTVFLSSHLMGEVAQTADQLLVVGQGRLIVGASTEEIVHGHARSRVRVRTVDGQDVDHLVADFVACGLDVSVTTDGALLVIGLDSSVIGRMAADREIALAELTPEEATLEEAFLELTQRSTDHHAGLAGATQGA
jgi:ABC-2 type transport system ATP-binding protein